MLLKLFVMLLAAVSNAAEVRVVKGCAGGVSRWLNVDASRVRPDCSGARVVAAARTASPTQWSVLRDDARGDEVTHARGGCVFFLRECSNVLGATAGRLPPRRADGTLRGRRCPCASGVGGGQTLSYVVVPKPKSPRPTPAGPKTPGSYA